MSIRRSQLNEVESECNITVGLLPLRCIIKIINYTMHTVKTEDSTTHRFGFPFTRREEVEDKTRDGPYVML